VSVTVDEVERRIEEAFSVFPMPDAEEIAEPKDAWEAQALKAIFAGKHWREVPFEILMYCRGDLIFLSAKAWVYYLPALLVSSLRTRNPDLVDATVSALTPIAEDWELEWFNARLSLLGQGQRELIRDFLHLVWPLFYDELDEDQDPRPFWDALVTMPGGIAAKPGALSDT
jgi:uncharacterized protein DUF6714